MKHLSAEVCILGAGPAGIGVADELRRHGLTDIVIVDRNERLGGLARTEVFDGNRFDIGPHRFFTKNTEVEQRWKATLGADFRSVSRLTRIYYGQKYFDYPLRATNALKHLGLRKAIPAIASYAAAQLHQKGTPQNFEEWIISKFGARLYQAFFKTYTEKVWGIACTEIGAEWAAQRVKGLDMKSLVMNTLGFGGSGIKTLVDEFNYPVHGAGMMYEALGANAALAGARFLMESEVTAIYHSDGTINSVEIEAPRGEKTTVTARHFFTSLPLTRFVEMLKPSLTGDIVAAAKELYFRDHITVNLLVDGANLFPDQWIYVHSPDVKMARLANYNNFSGQMADKPGTTPLSVEYFAWATDDLWSMADKELAALALEELEYMGLLSRRRILNAWVVREKDSYPTYFLGHDRPLKLLKQAMAAFSNCAPVGRGGMYKYNNMDHSLFTGILAARNFAANGDFDTWKVNTDAEYHESAKIMGMSTRP